MSLVELHFDMLPEPAYVPDEAAAEDTLSLLDGGVSREEVRRNMLVDFPND